MVVLLVYQRAYGKHGKRISESKKMKLYRRDRIVDNYYSKVLDINVNRVEKKHFLNLGREAFNGIKNYGKIHKELSENIPKILHIAEENEERRKNKSHSEIEYYQTQNRENKKEKRPRKGYSVKNTEDEKYDKSQSEIYKR